MSARQRFTLRQKGGALLLDVPRLLAQCSRLRGWVGVRNRGDVLQFSDEGPGVICEGNWSSDIHACAVFPRLGSLIMKQAMKDWPFRLWEGYRTSQPRVTFVIPHRGPDRLPLLRLTVASILGQKDVEVECIVVEQSVRQEVSGLPAFVRHIHLPHETDPEPWRKSWAFNVGVAAARSEIVVCHDGDILVPEGYATEIVRGLSDKDVMHPQRFLFCLDRRDTEKLVSGAGAAFLRSSNPMRVRQNWQGGTLAIRRDAFFSIGGFDERFVDWGGEDNEFFDRCRVLSRNAYGYLPFVHLWHRDQNAKQGVERSNALTFLHERLATPRAERIAELRRMRADERGRVVETTG